MHQVPDQVSPVHFFLLDSTTGSSFNPPFILALLPQSASQINIGTTIRKRKAKLEVLSESRQIGVAGSPPLPLMIEDLDNLDDINSRIDPRLRASVANITRVVRDVDEEEVSSDEIEEIVLEGLDVPLETPSSLLVPGMAYISLLSRVNVITNKRLSSTKSKAIPDAFRGNGKDKLILFQHHCQKTPAASTSQITRMLSLSTKQDAWQRELRNSTQSRRCTIVP